jgi:hypothetical protein
MRVTLKAVNEKLAAIGAKTELAKGAGYFLFRGGEAEEWIERTVRVPLISSLTMEQWIGEYERLKALNEDMTKAPKQAPAKPAQPEKYRVERSKPAQMEKHRVEQPKPAVREAPRKGACDDKAKLLAELEQVHRELASIEEQAVRAAREDRTSELATLSAAASRERAKFDRALLAVRDHTLVHGC